jgi:transposase
MDKYDLLLLIYNYIENTKNYIIFMRLTERRLNYIENEESYTSKCSALDLEPLNKQENYMGKRIKRGMFKSKNRTKINADLNGALNILRKVAPDKGQEIVQTQGCREAKRFGH